LTSPRAFLAWSWTASILALCWFPRSLMPVKEAGPGPIGIPHLDKVVHFGLFAVFALLWARATGHQLRRVFLAGCGLAILTELGQMVPVVGRDAGLDDGLADVVGVAAGLGAYLLSRRIGIKAPTPMA